ncbi:peptidoglycan-binding protein [Anthocerotibacter panamensis]|uniref:peptidoglycan-binding protein n=1 Tax=Anthocerotibacter panamensis TaxID=2857077 RepID=UPI001C4075DF|nr:peptidoglycan-binding protein [Anthocerotibacter panamensis]
MVAVRDINISAANRVIYGNTRDTNSAPRAHAGVDTSDPNPQALLGGVVVYVGNDPSGYYRYIDIYNQQSGVVERLAELDRLNYRFGDRVPQGAVVGSGNSNTGVTHREIRPYSGRIEDYNPQFGIRNTVDWATYAVDTGLYVQRGKLLDSTGRATPAIVDIHADKYRQPLIWVGGRDPAAVTQLQTQLRQLGYDLGTSGPNRNGVDGQWGQKTLTALQDFQRQHSLVPHAEGIVSAGTWGVLAEAVQQRTGTPTQPVSTPTQPAPTANQPVRASDGPFAGVSQGSLLSESGSGRTLSSLSAQETYQTARAVFGDSAGTRALIALDQHYGPGDGTLVKRELALGLHEGSLNFGRRNEDPASGFNYGTFQIGGAGTTSETSRTRYNSLVERGINAYEAISSQRVDRSHLTVADRDIFAHIGHIEERSTFRRGNETGLFRELANPNLQGENLVRFESTDIQGGIRDIGVDVQRLTGPNGLRVDLNAVNQRTQEAPTSRVEPAFPQLSRANTQGSSPAVQQLQTDLKALGYNLGTSGPAHDGVDGQFGRTTQGIVRQFQQAHNLPDTGTVGPLTRQALNEALAQRDPSRSITPSQSTAQLVPEVTELRGITLANAAQVILDYRGTAQPDGSRTYDGSTYDLQQKGNILSISAEGRGEIFRTEGGRISINSVTDSDVTRLGQAAFQINYPQQQTVPVATPAPTQQTQGTVIEFVAPGPQSNTAQPITGERLAQATVFAQAADIILDKRGQQEAGRQSYTGSTLDFLRQGDTLTVTRGDQELLRQVGSEVVSFNATPQDIAQVNTAAQLLDVRESNTTVFAQAAQEVLRQQGEVQGNALVYQGNTYTIQNQGDIFTVAKGRDEIFRQVGSEVVTQKVGLEDLQAFTQAASLSQEASQQAPQTVAVALER